MPRCLMPPSPAGLPSHLSSTEWLIPCRLFPRHWTMSSVHSRWAWPVLFASFFISTNFNFLYGTIWPICAESAIKPQTKDFFYHCSFGKYDQRVFKLLHITFTECRTWVGVVGVVQCSMPQSAVLLVVMAALVVMAVVDRFSIFCSVIGYRPMRAPGL